MYYCGLLKNSNVAEVFYSRTPPTRRSHGHLYHFTFGGYTKEKAFQVANYQYPYAKVRFFDGRKKTCLTDHNLYAIAGIV